MGVVGAAINVTLLSDWSKIPSALVKFAALAVFQRAFYFKGSNIDNITPSSFFSSDIVLFIFIYNSICEVRYVIHTGTRPCSRFFFSSLFFFNIQH